MGSNPLVDAAAAWPVMTGKPLGFTTVETGEFYFRYALDGEDIIYQLMPRNVHTKMPLDVSKRLQKAFEKVTSRVDEIKFDIVPSKVTVEGYTFDMVVPVAVMRADKFAENPLSIEPMTKGIADSVAKEFSS